jgi:hypothetical protein
MLLIASVEVDATEIACDEVEVSPAGLSEYKFPILDQCA